MGSPAACSRWACTCGSWWEFTTACASASDSAWKSTSCQRVRVPPQSKMTASTPLTSTTGADAAAHVVHDVVGRHVLTIAGRPVLDLHGAVRQALADHHDRRHADQLGVLELHAGADLGPVVVQHLDALAGQLVGDPLGRGEDVLVLAGRDQVDVGRRDLAGPGQAQLVVGALGDRGHGPGGADAVRAHGDRHELAVLVEDLEVEGVGVLAAELEDVAHLDAARGLERAVLAVRAGVTVADLGGLDGAVRGEVTPGDQVDDVAAVDVGAGDPAGALDDARVDEVADARGVLLAQHLGADVALDQRRVLPELRLVEGLDLGGLHLPLEPLLVDLAVAGDADRDRLA